MRIVTTSQDIVSLSAPQRMQPENTCLLAMGKIPLWQEGLQGTPLLPVPEAPLTPLFLHSCPIHKSLAGKESLHQSKPMS